MASTSETLYVRVKQENKEWLANAAIKADASMSSLVDAMLDALRKRQAEFTMNYTVEISERTQ